MKLMRLGALGCALSSIYMWPSKVAAALVNGTIDDRFGDSVTHRLVNYYPSQDLWFNESCGCNDGIIAANKSKAFDNTFSMAFGGTGVGIGMQFIGSRPHRICLFRCPNRRSTGTAIYVFFILDNLSSLDTLNSAYFTLDSNDALLFRRDVSTIQYDALVFSQTNLSNNLHTLNISTTSFGEGFFNFDYAIYT
jgi:hypothetical protein